MQIKRYLENSCLWIRDSRPAPHLCYTGINYCGTWLEATELHSYSIGIWGGESVSCIFRGLQVAEVYLCHKLLIILNKVPFKVSIKPLLFPLILAGDEDAQGTVAGGLICAYLQALLMPSLCWRAWSCCPCVHSQQQQYNHCCVKGLQNQFPSPSFAGC